MKKTKILIIALLLSFTSIAQQTNYQKKQRLSLPDIFADNMVLQQELEIPVWGTAYPKDNIFVEFDGVIVSTITSPQGKWQVNLPKQKADGKTHQLEVRSKDISIIFKNILIGEVWLASGQSNMHLDMRRTENGEENAKLANNKKIRLFNMRPTYPTAEGGIHTKEELNAINNNDYFKTETWIKANPETVIGYSAVAYYFAEKLQKELGVPIGIIHNAVPGAPTESWINKEVLIKHPQYKTLVETNWKENEKNNVGKILLTVAKNQVKLSEDSLQKHPWMPAYNYKNGIEPIIPFAMRGIIWYQGESNVNDYKMHADLLKMLVKSWRKDWNNEKLPFVYAQLSSRAERPEWPEFRDSQRRLLEEIPYSGMAIISDVGDENDTHAKKKQPVGERLALWILATSYKKDIVYSGPLYKEIKVIGKEIHISFTHTAEGLKTSDKKSVRGFELKGANGNFASAKAKIKGNKIILKLPKGVKKPIVRYAWKSFTDANLVNSADLPASTFVSE